MPEAPPVYTAGARTAAPAPAADSALVAPTSASTERTRRPRTAGARGARRRLLYSFMLARFPLTVGSNPLLASESRRDSPMGLLAWRIVRAVSYTHLTLPT